MVDVVAGTSCGGEPRSASPCAYAGRFATGLSADLGFGSGLRFFPPSIVWVRVEGMPRQVGAFAWMRPLVEGVCEEKVFFLQG